MRLWLVSLLVAACGGTHSAPGATTSDGGLTPDGAAPGGSHAICDAYVSCVGNTTPAGLSAVLAAYGTNGACWSSAASSVCLQACRTGLQQSHVAFPSQAACPDCLLDDDCAQSASGHACDATAGRCVQCTGDSACGGATPACSTTTHQCVECAANSDCKTGVCNLSTNHCTRCLHDGDCAAPTPHCVQSQGTSECVGCSGDNDCASGVCNSNSCCTPESCGEVSHQWGTGLGVACGISDSRLCGGGTVSCGACARGTCDNGLTPSLCTLAGTPCTPAQSGACLPNEVCSYAPNVGGYVCATDLRGTTCVYGADSYSCGANRLYCDGANLVDNGVCVSYCLSSSDCRGNEHCLILSGNYGTCETN